MSMHSIFYLPLFALAQPADESLKDLILRGGYLMIPIGICSLIALSLIHISEPTRPY